ncbi:MAG: hypothetical protein GF317_09805 [Candidatus Lokiarchaeota archaeon]|nr:hypothetical protein [Candidatus Lokiarchaeota archaeon]
MSIIKGILKIKSDFNEETDDPENQMSGQDKVELIIEDILEQLQGIQDGIKSGAIKPKECIDFTPKSATNISTIYD